MTRVQNTVLNQQQTDAFCLHISERGTWSTGRTVMDSAMAEV